MPISLLDLWSDEKTLNKIVSGITGRSDFRAMVTGLDGSARTFFMAALAQKCSRPALVIVRDSDRAEKVYSDLSSFFHDQVSLLPPREFVINSEVLSRSEEYQQMRLQFLEWLYGNDKGIYVTTVTSLLAKMLPVSTWNELNLHFKSGKQLDRQELIVRLIEMGYERVSLTEARGQFSARGEIIDIYPPGQQLPVRLELFDNYIQSLRRYDPSTQRSTEKMTEAVIMPARELVLTEEIFQRGNKLIQHRMDQTCARLQRRGEKDAAEKLKQDVNRHLEKLAQPEGLDYLSSYFPFFYDNGSTLLDYLPSDFLVFIEEPRSVAEAGENFRRDFDNYFNSALVERELLASADKLLWTESDLFSRLPCPLVSCSLFSGTGGIFKTGASFNLDTKSVPNYHGQWELFKSDYQGWIKNGFRVYLLSYSNQRGRNLLEQLSEHGVFKPVENFGMGFEETQVPECLPMPPVIEGSLDDGLIIPELQVAIVTEQNLLPQVRKKKRLGRREGIRLSDYRELSGGDYVVHEQHGIGKYQGLSTLEICGVKRDYLLLKYRGADKLYIPVDQIGLIQKHSGSEGPPPSLHSLGGGEWQRLKKKVNRSVEELARELLSLYAARQAVEGYRFGPDHPWQQEFETHFPYEETPDQLQAINDVKSDLEKQHPMDRLVCGDVGYGKTEVAMRAAFKVVMEGKQVAVLVPTTVLAQQHYRTFRQRLEGFPVRVAQLSRFVSKTAQKDVIKAIASGKVDIVVGTHRLLSADLKFNDLGLLVLDEEHRFGVRQKEIIKKKRLEVDTLAMTATPIPRTLHLSLAGARDLSVIDTPPEDRFPVQTYVVEYSEDIVQEAVQRELNRDGQVFIVLNRVDQIDSFAERIRNLFPGVSVAVGHGRMPETTLERVMADFQDGRYQILVCTTIIESGLDIPNVNTLIVNEADKFGLAQLYQIRGRVGRSNRLAYAYLTYRKDKVVSAIAQKRLKTVKEFIELGSGFKIALRDLEIRGAGNILGSEQHGFINAVGFDLYCKLLDRAVAELKNEKPENTINPRLELQVSAYLPSSYIASQAQKVDFYQRIYNAKSREELREIEEEISDCYGSPGEAAKNLLAAAELRVLAVKLGVELIQQQQKDTYIQFCPGSLFNSALVKKTAYYKTGKITIKTGKPLKLKITEKEDLAAQLNALILFFKELLDLQTEAAGSHRAI